MASKLTHEQHAHEQHKQRHIELHKYLDELLADFIEHTREQTTKPVIQIPIGDLIIWSYEQTINPEEKQNGK